MALGKNSRGERRNCSTVSVAVFVAFCLVGVWIVMSSIDPIQNLVMQVSETETINEVKDIASESGSRQYEEGLGENIPEESTRVDSQNHKSQSETSPGNQDDRKGIENVSDNRSEYNQHEVVKDVSGKTNDLDKGPGSKIEENDQIRHVKPSIDKKQEESHGYLNSESRETETLDGQINEEVRGSMESLDERESDKSINGSELGTESTAGETIQLDERIGESEEEKVKENLRSKPEQSAGEDNMESHEKSPASKEVSITGIQTETLIEASTENTEKGTFSTQAAELQHRKDPHKSSVSIESTKYDWKLCNTTTGSEYIPCLDNWQAIRRLHSIMNYEHWERHCPEETPTCLVSLPEGYRIPIKWPKSREMVCNT